jgi:hypothetical protein
MLMAGIPKIVEQQLHAMERIEDHPDPNLLGALVEKSLAQGEQLPVLEHLSRCASCREIVSLTAAQPGIAGAVSLAPARAGWLSWPVLRWGAAVACVVVVGVAVTIRQEHESRQIDAMIAEQKAELEKQISPPSSPPAKAAEQTIALQLLEEFPRQVAHQAQHYQHLLRHQHYHNRHNRQELYRLTI